MVYLYVNVSARYRKLIELARCMHEKSTAGEMKLWIVHSLLVYWRRDDISKVHRIWEV